MVTQRARALGSAARGAPFPRVGRWQIVAVSRPAPRAASCLTRRGHVWVGRVSRPRARALPGLPSSGAAPTALRPLIVPTTAQPTCLTLLTRLLSSGRNDPWRVTTCHSPTALHLLVHRGVGSCIASTVHMAVTHSLELGSSDVPPTQRLASQSSQETLAASVRQGGLPGAATCDASFSLGCVHRICH